MYMGQGRGDRQTPHEVCNGGVPWGLVGFEVGHLHTWPICRRPRWSQLASELIIDGRSGIEDGVARMTDGRAARMTKVASLTELELR